MGDENSKTTRKKATRCHQHGRRKEEKGQTTAMVDVTRIAAQVDACRVG
jgi:hypothetical protein